MLKRRAFLIAMAGLSSLLLPLKSAVAKASDKSLEAIRNGWRKLLPAGVEVPKASDPVAKTDAEWRTELRPEAYRVLFEEATEPAFTSPLNDERRRGVFACVACNLPLFTSEMKFDSGTGWPSFITHIPGHLDTKTDFKLIWPRTEYHCIRCGGHQGHVFDDGPPPTGERWCNNGVALRFMPADSPS